MIGYMNTIQYSHIYPQITCQTDFNLLGPVFLPPISPSPSTFV